MFPLFCVQRADATRKTDVFGIHYISKMKQSLAKKDWSLFNTLKQTSMKNFEFWQSSV